MCILKLSKTNKNHMLKAKYFILLICFSFLLKTEAKVTLTSIWGDNMVLPEQQLRENVYRLPLHGIIKKSKRTLMQKVNGNFLSKHR